MIRRLWSEQIRVTFWAWIATLCAAAMLAPLTVSKRYLVIGAVGAAAVSITGALLRSRRAHPLVVLFAELVVAVEWLVLAFARNEAALGFLPGPDAISELRNRWSDYADFANQFAAPLPQNDDVTMAMATVLVGLAVVVDIVAASWRRAALLGLVFLAVYMTPVSILGGEISVLAFLIGALGYVFLLAADERERLTHWGRQISTAGSVWDRPTEVDEGGLRRNGTRVGLSAIALAAVVPLLVPTLSPHYFGQSGSGGSGGSGGTVVEDNLALDLRRNLSQRSDTPLLRVTTEDPEPKYFQLAVMDEFNGEFWKVGDRSEDNSVAANDALPVPTDLDVATASELFSYEVTIDEDFDTTWLPLRYLTTSIQIDQPWRVDRTHRDAYTDSDEDASGLSYSFTADLISATTGQMNSALPPTPDYDYFTDLPPDLPGDFERVARQVTTPGQSMFNQARAIEDWFRAEFEYDLDAASAPGENIDDLVNFLVEDRVGYCEQFASAMAIMARTLDIPARVAIGFLEPDQIDDNTWEFRGTDMHAWPELHFEGAGWVRFEPTPDTAESDGAEPLNFVTGPANTLPTSPSAPTDPTARNTREQLDQPSGSTADDENAGAGGGSDIWWIGPVAVLGLAFLLSLPRLTRAFVRRRRWSRARGSVQAAEAAWAELRDHVVDLRMAWDAGATPRAIGRSLRERLPDDRTGSSDIVPALNHLVLAIEQARYARSIQEADGLRNAQMTVAEALSSRQTPGLRFLARWLPASLVRSRRRTAVRNERLGELLVSIED